MTKHLNNPSHPEENVVEFEDTINEVEIHEIFKPLFQPFRTKVFYGGRGGMKSWGFAQCLLLIASRQKKRIMCTREMQKSLEASVHQLLSDTIFRMGLESFYAITQNKIIGKNGSTFIFEGLHANPNGLKSFEGIDICWCEESESITESSWEKLLPTIRAPGSEIWISFNPADELDPTYTQFVTPYLDDLNEFDVHQGKDIFVQKTSWKMNRWISKALTIERLRLKASNPTKYKHIWGGEPLADHEYSIIQPSWFDAAVDAHIKLKYKPKGARILSHDPADGGSDNQSSIFRYGSVVTNIEDWKGVSLEEGCNSVYDIATANQAQIIIYDVGGLGVGARIKYDQLDPLNKIDKQPFNGASSPRNGQTKYKNDLFNDDVFYNRRAQGYITLADRFEATYRAVVLGEYVDPEEMISISSDCKYIKKLKSELTKIQKKSGTGRALIQIESKLDMRQRGIKSPNLADSLMYCFSNDTPQTETEPPTINYASQW